MSVALKRFPDAGRRRFDDGLPSSPEIEAGLMVAAVMNPGLAAKLSPDTPNRYVDDGLARVLSHAIELGAAVTLDVLRARMLSASEDWSEAERILLDAVQNSTYPPTVAGGLEFEARLRELAAQRELVLIAGEVEHSIRNGGDAAESIELLERAVARARGISKPVGPAVLTCLADVEPEAIEWVVPPMVAVGKLAMVLGDPGDGKSTLTIALAAGLTRGYGLSGELITPGSVVLLTAEDGLADTVRPRLDAAGADCARVVALTAVRSPGGGASSGFSLERDLAALEDAIVRTPGVRLAIVDPISAYMGKTDSHRNADVRGVLAPLTEMAARRRIGILAVDHLNKGQASKVLYRASGSLAFVAAARIVFLLTRDRQDRSRRLLLPVKCNIAPETQGRAFRLQDGTVAWEAGPVTIDASESLADDGEAGAVDEACEWLRDALMDGAVPSGELERRARQDAISQASLKRAKQRLRVRSFKQPGRGAPWACELPTSSPCPP